MTRQAVIVGRGAVTPAGIGVSALWSTLRDGRSCVRAEPLFDVQGIPMAGVSARIPDADLAQLAERSERRSDAECLLWEVLRQALDEARVEPGSLPATALLTTQLPEPAREGLGSTLAHDLGKRLDTRLHLTSLHATCATGLRLVCEAARLIELGQFERVIVGVVSRPLDAVHIAAFGRALALSRWDGAPQAASRPFDQRRSGFVFGEAAGALVIEAEDLARSRGAPGFGRILGWGLAMNAQHFLRTSMKHMVGVQRAALARSGCEPRDIDLFDAMGSSSPIGDADEARSIHRVFAERLPELWVSASKAVLGYSSQASAVAELVVCTAALAEGIVPPVPTCEAQEPDLELPLARVARPANLRRVLKHAFGMGGHYGALVFERMG